VKRTKSKTQNLNLAVSLAEANRISSILEWVKIACKMNEDEIKMIDSFLYKIRAEKKLNDL
jgi:hypothetical protein